MMNVQKQKVFKYDEGIKAYVEWINKGKEQIHETF